MRKIFKTNILADLEIAREVFSLRLVRQLVHKVFTTKTIKISLNFYNSKIPSLKKEFQIIQQVNLDMERISTSRTLSYFSNFRDLKTRWSDLYWKLTILLKQKATNGICYGHHAPASHTSTKA